MWTRATSWHLSTSWPRRALRVVAGNLARANPRALRSGPVSGGVSLRRAGLPSRRNDARPLRYRRRRGRVAHRLGHQDRDDRGLSHDRWRAARGIRLRVRPPDSSGSSPASSTAVSSTTPSPTTSRDGPSRSCPCSAAPRYVGLSVEFETADVPHVPRLPGCTQLVPQPIDENRTVCPDSARSCCPVRNGCSQRFTAMNAVQ